MTFFRWLMFYKALHADTYLYKFDKCFICLDGKLQWKYVKLIIEPGHADLYISVGNDDSIHNRLKLELVCLRSEDTPGSPVATLTSSYWIQVKTRQSQSYKFKEFAKTSNVWILKKNLTRDTLSKVAW